MAPRKPKAAVKESLVVSEVFCPGCGQLLADWDVRLVHAGCPEDRRLWVSVPPPS
jgi:hypothetical protein